MYVVTGAAGMIGANIIKAMNEAGIDNIIAVDNLANGDKFRNMVDLNIVDYYDKRDFRKLVASGELNGKIKAVLHQGACSATTETDGLYVMDNNYRYSVELLHFCQAQKIPFLYASSAAVYGRSVIFTETPVNEGPLNVYGYSKLLFDQYVRRVLPKKTAQIVGFRYFNVYGQREGHKGSMASVAYHFFNQYINEGHVRLFSGTEGVANGEQLRDFVYVDDIAKANLWFLQNGHTSGVFNLGTGKAATYNEMAMTVINTVHRLQQLPESTLSDLQKAGAIRYIPFPEHLKGKYQNFTQANLTDLRERGNYTSDFLSITEAVPLYVEQLYILRQQGIA